VRWGFEQAAKHSRRVIVEEQYVGRDYRILVVGGKVVAVAERVPARVVGDGRSTVAQLIETVNQDPRRGVGHEAVMTRIVVDDHLIDRLERAGLELQSVPASGQIVTLRATANLSTGGTAIDRTDEIHPDNASIARRAALTVGLDVAGIDFMAPTSPARCARRAAASSRSTPRPASACIWSRPKARRATSPRRSSTSSSRPARAAAFQIVAVTGTNGKSTVGGWWPGSGARWAAVGLTNTSGVYIDDERILAADASGPKSARMVLRDPTVEVAVLETARGGMLREGLAFDRCDVGMVLNVTADHLGLKGVDTLEDLAAVKSIVTEAVGRRGVSVLNGDDPLTLRMARHAGGRIAYFTLRGRAGNVALPAEARGRRRPAGGARAVGARRRSGHPRQGPAHPSSCMATRSPRPWEGWPSSTSPTPWRRSPPATAWARRRP
jgi:cyanophycin synthetase